MKLAYYTDSFHPELGSDARVHRRLVALAREACEA